MMDVMETIQNYPQEEQVRILATLKVVQDRGWSQKNSDPFQFHIILGEKIIALEEKIQSLESVLENNEEQNLQKEKNNKDLTNDLKKEREINRDLEEEFNVKFDEIDHIKKYLHEKENEIEQMKKVLHAKENEFDDLEVFVKQRVEEIKYLRENNASMAQQVGEAIKTEKKVEIQSKVIQELQDNLKKKENVETAKEVQTLLRDIGQLQMDVEEKEKLLESVTTENNEIKEKLHILEEKNVDLKRSNEITKVNGPEIISLQEELENSSLKVFLKQFKCKTCADKFACFGDLKEHIRNKHEEVSKTKKIMGAKLKELEQKISEQQLDVTLKLFSLKEKEIKEQTTCRCRGFCNINHLKHNWQTSKSSQIISKLI